MKKLSILFLLLSLTINAQSPWTKNKNEGYFQLTYTSISNYDKLFGENDIDLGQKVSDNTVQLYGEYGISDKTTLLVNVPFKLTSLDNGSSISENAIGNLQLGVKHNFINKNWLLSAQLNVEANTSSYNQIGLRTGYDAWTFTPLILAGKGFNNWYVQAFTGFDIRTNNYSSNYKLGGEIGYKTLNWLWIAGFLDGVASLENGDIVLPQENLNTGLYINDQSYAAFGLKMIGEINKNFGANLGFGGAFAGRNVAKALALSFGMYYKF